MILNNKIIVQFFIPALEDYYEIFIPKEKKLSEIINTIQDEIVNLSDNTFKKKLNPVILNKSTGEFYNLDCTIKDSSIMNGTILVLM